MPTFSSDTWHRYLAEGTSTFDFTVHKFVNGVFQDYCKLINDQAYFSFRYKGKDYLFYVLNMVEDDYSIQLSCNNLNLELKNEMALSFKSEEAQSLEWYLTKMEILNFARIRIAVNELSDRKRALTFDGQETKLARLISVIRQFEGEFEFETNLTKNGAFKELVLNIYHEHDDNHQGVGRLRGDVKLRYGRELKGVQRTVDKSQLFNVLFATGTKTEGEETKTFGIENIEREIKNEDGRVEFYTRKGSRGLYAPLSVEMFPASASLTSDEWIRNDLATEYSTEEALWGYMLKWIKQHAYPVVTYAVSVRSDMVAGHLGLELGDIVKIQDNNFVGGLILKARITEQIISFSNPNNNNFVFSNIQKLKNAISSSLQERMARLAEEAQPYEIELSTDRGWQFKNGQGESIVSPTLRKGKKQIIADVSYRFYFGTEVIAGQSYKVVAAKLSDTQVFTVAAYIKNTEVARTQLTFVNINDGRNGRDGAKGDKGETGAKGDKGDRGEKGDRGDRGERGLQGLQGLQGVKGDQGIPGPKGADGRTQYTHLAYADTVSGSGFSQTDADKAYIGFYVDFNITDSVNPADYRWTRWRGPDGKNGKDGAQGIPGKPGADGRTPYFHRAWANSADGRDGFSTSDSTNKRYLGTQTDFTEADSQDHTRYKWTALFDNVEVGGRNLLKGSKGPFKPNRNPSNFDNNVLYHNETSIYMVNGQRYRISAKTDGTFTSHHDGFKESDNVVLWIMDKAVTNYQIVSDAKTGTTGTEFVWSRPTGTYHLRVNTYRKDPQKLKSVWEVKVEQGTVKTDWSPAPEDVQADIDSKADQILTQEQLNALNEKAGIIQAELEAKASVATLDNWLKAYQDYVKANDKARAQAEKDLVSATQRVSTIAKNLGELSDRWNFIDTYMSSSNDGLVIGKNDGSSSMMFNPNGRISMFSAGVEVMYISQGVIYIENGIFSKTIQIGRFREEQYHLNPDMNVIRYVGGA
ncbi:TPA: phage tail protein [Streptococcus pyogenes]|nr:phage tail protein [Streptococcus pyogenes]